MRTSPWECEYVFDREAARRSPGRTHPSSAHTHTPALAPALTSPGAPGAGAPALAGAVEPGGRGGGGGSCWLRRAICLCSRSTSRWDSRSNLSKSRTWSHWGPSWSGGPGGVSDLINPYLPPTIPGRASPPPCRRGSDVRQPAHPPMHACPFLCAVYTQPHVSTSRCTDIHSNSFTGCLQCALHCAKCLVNIPSQVCVYSYLQTLQTHWHTALNLKHRWVQVWDSWLHPLQFRLLLPSPTWAVARGTYSPAASTFPFHLHLINISSTSHNQADCPAA